MGSSKHITIEHTVIASNQPYDKVLVGLASRMGSEEGSLLAQCQREEITQVAQVVEQKLEALLAAVTQ